MKIETLKGRLKRDRPMTSVTLRMPEDVVEDFKRIAPKLGFFRYQPLIRAYVGQSLRADLERLERPDVDQFIECLKRRGVSNTVIEEAHDEITNGEA